MFSGDKMFQNLLALNLLWLTALTAHVTKSLHPKCIGFLMTQFYKCCLHHFFPRQSPTIAVLEIGMCWNWSISFSLLYSFYYLCAITYCHKHRGKWLVMHFSLTKVSKHDFGEGIVPCPATFWLSLTAAARLVEHTDHKFNQSWLIAEPN